MNTWSDRQRCRSHRVTATVGVINGEQIQPGAASVLVMAKTENTWPKKLQTQLGG